MARRWTKRRLLLLLVAALPVGIVGVILARAFWPLGDVPLVYSKETTYYTGPVRADGTVDYVRIVTRVLAEGVTRENNAAVLLLRAFGPSYVGGGEFGDDEVASDEVASDKVASDKVASDEVASDEVASDESGRIEFKTVLEALEIPALEARGPYFVSDDEFEELEESDDEPDEYLSEQLDRAQQAPWTAGELPRVAEWLQANEEPLALISAALEKPRFFVPVFRPDQPLVDRMYHHIQPVVDAARALQCRATLELGRGHTRAAWKDILICRRLGTLVAREPWLITMIVGYSVQGIAWETATVLLATGDLAAGEARRMLQDWQALPPVVRLEDAMEFERLLALDVIMTLLRPGSKKIRDELGLPSSTWIGLDPNPVLRRINRSYDDLSRALAAGSYRGSLEQVGALCRRFETESQEVGKSLSSPWGVARFFLESSREKRRQLSDALGHVVMQWWTSGMESIVQRYWRRVACFRLIELGLALALHRAERGGYPDGLSELSPSYLENVPLDPFTEKPFQYRPDGKSYVLYSFGPDCDDDDGRELEVPDGDIAVTVPGPPRSSR